MWDASAGNAVTIDTGAAAMTYLALTLDGTVVFTRLESTGEDRMFAWDGATVTQLTDQDSDGVYHQYTAIGPAFGVTRQ